MPKSESSRLEALEQLLAERRKHEGYLAKLEERRAATPEHVFTRLRTEYLTKLTDLQVRAAAEAEGLEDGIEEDRTAVAALEERLAAVHEERLEGELRAEVGEYDPKDWTKKLTVLNATIAQLEKEREAKSGAWERTQRLVNEARAGIAGNAAPAEAPSAPAPVPPAAPAAEARPADAAAAAVSPPASPPAAPAGKKPTELAGAPSFDELAFLNSVVGRVSTPVPIPQPVPVPRASRPVPVESEPPTGPSVAPRAPTPARPPVEAVAPVAAAPASAPAPVAPAPPPPEPPPVLAPTPVRPAPAVAPAVAPSQEGPSAPAPAPREDEPPGPLGRPTPRTSQAIKTLKCQECGTFNYPTEWYCERCGGELAAL